MSAWALVAVGLLLAVVALVMGIGTWELTMGAIILGAILVVLGGYMLLRARRAV